MLTAYEFLSSSSSIIDDARRQILWGEKKGKAWYYYTKNASLLSQKTWDFPDLSSEQKLFCFSHKQ